MDYRSIFTIARLELLINIRNRWILVFALSFGALVLAISYFGLVTAGDVGFQGFSRTSASLLNLILYLVPLVCLLMGTLSLTSERSAGELVFCQPLTRTEILMGKVSGLFAAVVTAGLLGFGLAGLIVAAKAGTEGVLRYPILVVLSMALALVFICISAAVAVLCRRRPVAFGVSLLVWFFFRTLLRPPGHRPDFCFPGADCEQFLVRLALWQPG